MKQSSKNSILLAAAGSGKTTMLVTEALRDPIRRVLVVTYTVENVAQIEQYIVGVVGCIPSNITVLSWYAFLLRHAVRPYQRNVFPEAPRVKSVYFDRVPEDLSYVKKTKPSYYLTSSGLIYRDRLAAFAFAAHLASGGALMERLEKIYDLILIDELQDMAGYDLDLLEALFASSIEVFCGGDLRQATYTTNDHSRNKQYRGSQLLAWVKKLESAELISLKEQNGSHRCNAAICEFANTIFPEMAEIIPMHDIVTDHDGVVLLKPADVDAYTNKYHPQPLRYDRRAKTDGLVAMNFGAVKGRTYERVLIFPTVGIKKFLKSGLPQDIVAREKFYVAVTRARHSVAIVVG